MPALVIGWNWDRWRVAELIDRWLVGLLVICMLVGLTVEDMVGSEDLRGHVVLLIDKVDIGPARVVLSFLVVTCVYGVFRAVLRWSCRDLLRPLVSTGARSLDSYVLQAVCLLAIPILIVDRPWKPTLAIVIAVAVFAACWAWAEFRTRLGVDKLHRAPMLIVTSIADTWAGRGRRARGRNGERSDEQAGQEGPRVHR
ncbi:OpgC domain-containing protein [Gordonia neofelifaecis]|uniref:OpgC domain-containing protein n=1 Tax=Gordonia neofelifaecis TaxID=945692 RepID=UPI002367424C|nr:OpgC domain-containing protein [Gordonia neofelifaecis]